MRNQFKKQTGKKHRVCPMYEMWLVKTDVPVSFLIDIIKKHFPYYSKEAQNIAQEVIETGYAICGLYSKDTAESKKQNITSCLVSQKYNIKILIQKEVGYAVRKS